MLIVPARPRDLSPSCMLAALSAASAAPLCYLRTLCYLRCPLCYLRRPSLLLPRRVAGVRPAPLHGGSVVLRQAGEEQLAESLPEGSFREVSRGGPMVGGGRGACLAGRGVDASRTCRGRDASCFTSGASAVPRCGSAPRRIAGRAPSWRQNLLLGIHYLVVQAGGGRSPGAKRRRRKGVEQRT